MTPSRPIGNRPIQTDPFTTRRYRQFARNLGLTGAALDVGCNTGRGGQAFREAAPRLPILDGVELIAERLGRLPPGVYRNTWPGLLEDLPKDQPYMAVLAGEVIETFPKP